MTVKPSASFLHPEARSTGLRPTGVFDRISLRDHIIAVEIGAFEVERAVTQRLSFNVVVEVADVQQPLEDDVDKILSYDRVTDAISQALARRRVNLLETLAEDIAALILAAPQAQRVFLRIEKLDRGAGKLGVEIVRDAVTKGAARSDWQGAAPLIVVVPNDTDLSDWQPQFKAQAHPVLLLPDAHLGFTPTQNATANLRLELLAWESAAWTLSARSTDLGVVASRTEMEWGFGQSQVNVWAPMKQILDSPNPPMAFDAPVLATWLATELNGQALGIGDASGAELLSAQQFLDLP